MKPTPPELPGPPVVGHVFEFLKDRLGLLERGFVSLGPIFALRLVNQRTAVLIGSEYHQIFFTETDKKLSVCKAYKHIKAAFGEAGISAPPEVYSKQRPIFLKPLKSDRVAGYIPIMQQEVQMWLDSLGERGEMELSGEIAQLVRNVTAHTLMGQSFRRQVDRKFWDLYRILGNSLDAAVPSNLPLPKFIRRDRAKMQLQTLMCPLIAERRANPDDFNDMLQDFVTARYEDGRPVEDETILALTLSLLFAAHETTAGQATWTIIQLLQAPDYLGMVQQEISEHLPSEQPITGKVLSSLKHVFWAVQETTRMHPSADILMRTVEEDIEVGEYRIPKGWNVIVHAGIAQMLPTLFTQPEKYDPLRFDSGRAENRQRFSIIGFGGGRHKCPGMNFANNAMMIITSLLFQQFKLELVTKEPQTIYGMGAARPEKTMVRYMRNRLDATNLFA